MRTLIKNGFVVSTDDLTKADVLIDEERVVCLLVPGDTSVCSDIGATSNTVIDARGKYVIPSGIDSHTRKQLPVGGTFASDTFETGTRAAAWRGTPTIIDFAVQTYGQRVPDRLAELHEKAGDIHHVDCGSHEIVGGVDDDSLKVIDELVNERVTSVYLFITDSGVFFSDDGHIVRATQTAADNGSTIMMHAENGIAIDLFVAQALFEEKTDPEHHSLIRPWITACHRRQLLGCKRKFTTPCVSDRRPDLVSQIRNKEAYHADQSPMKFPAQLPLTALTIGGLQFSEMHV